MKLTGELLFKRILYLERRRCERTASRFCLLVITLESVPGINADQVEAIGVGLESGTRETDFTGWYRYPSQIAVLFTSVGDTYRETLRAVLLEKARKTLQLHLSAAQVEALQLSLHIFPDDEVDKENGLDSEVFQSSSDPEFRRAPYAVKRMIDIAGSSAAILALSPVMIFIALAIKWTSKGPVFFKQKRIGQLGKEFTFLKFRSMIANNDPEIHREFVRRLIAAKSRKGDSTFKIKDDPRVTPFGRFLRRSSLDELPQFFNVLKGDMSLVGPRPPIRYELESYALWHRRRILEAKPGITGPWQVEGRSRTTFDEMVRMDLKYVKEQSLFLDLKILLKTPVAVFRGQGAY